MHKQTSEEDFMTLPFSIVQHIFKLFIDMWFLQTTTELLKLRCRYCWWFPFGRIYSVLVRDHICVSRLSHTLAEDSALDWFWLSLGSVLIKSMLSSYFLCTFSVSFLLEPFNSCDLFKFLGSFVLSMYSVRTSKPIYHYSIHLYHD